MSGWEALLRLAEMVNSLLAAVSFWLDATGLMANTLAARIPLARVSCSSVGDANMEGAILG